MNDDYKYIESDLRDIQRTLIDAKKYTASLISNILYNPNEEMKNEPETYGSRMTKNAIKLFTKIADLIEVELDDIQKYYMCATNGTKNDTNDN